MNSWFGEVLNLSARLIDGKDIVTKPDLRRIKKTDRESVKLQYEKEVEEENKVILDIDIPANKNFIARLNGFPVTNDRLKLMQEEKLQNFNRQLEKLTKLRDAGLFAARKVMTN